MKGCKVLNIINIVKHIRWALGTLNIATSATATAGNLLIIIVILTRKQLRTRPNSLICCLAVTDLAVGIIMQPIISVQLFNENAGRNCGVTYALYCIGTMICGCSSLILVLISYDRYLHLTKLQNYSKHMPRRKIIILLAFCWIIPAISGSLVFEDYTRFVMYIMSISALFFCTVALVFFNKKIYRFIKNRSKVFPVSVATKPKTAEQMRVRRQTKLAKTLLIIVGCFVICWMPFVVYYLYAFIDTIFGIIAPNDLAYADTMHCIGLTLGLLNSSINPAVYFWRNKTLRTEARKFILNHCDQP